MSGMAGGTRNRPRPPGKPRPRFQFPQTPSFLPPENPGGSRPTHDRGKSSTVVPAAAGTTEGARRTGCCPGNANAPRIG